MASLSLEQLQAIDTAPDDEPARFMDPATKQTFVLLNSDDFDWVRSLVSDEPDTSRLADSRTGQEYALIPIERYERYKAFFEEDPITLDERKAMLRAAGLRAGWNEPVWDEGDKVEREAS